MLRAQTAVAGARAHQWPWLRQVVAAVYTGDGRRIDGSRVVAERGAALPRATVAPTARGLKSNEKNDRGTEQDKFVYKEGKRAQREAENPIRDLMTG